jgi:hypothetical protein
MYVIQHCFSCRPSDSTVSEDAGIIDSQTLSSTSRLDLIHIRLDFINTQLDLSHSRLDLIHHVILICMAQLITVFIVKP